MVEFVRPTFEESRQILGIENPEMERLYPIRGPYQMDPQMAGRIHGMLQEGTPLYDMDRYSAFLGELQQTDLDALPASPGSYRQLEWTFTTIGALGACSAESAALQSADLQMAPPRVTTLADHNQDVINTAITYGALFRTDPRDSILAVAATQQDGGKSLAVALEGSNRAQGKYNLWVAENVWEHVPNDVLTSSAKRVGKLLIQEHFIGRAIGHHVQKGKPLVDMVEAARQGLDELKAQCPDDYRDRFDLYLLASYMFDSAAHREEAQHIDAHTGHAVRAVDEEVDLTLSYLYDSSVPDRLRFRSGPARVIRALFPDLADYYE